MSVTIHRVGLNMVFGDLDGVSFCLIVENDTNYGPAVAEKLAHLLLKQP